MGIVNYKMRLLPSIILALVNAKPEDRLTALESKLAHLEQLIGTLDASPFDGDCNSGGTLEQLNAYLCDLSANTEEFVEATRENYIDLQLRLEANTATIDGIKDELNDQEQMLTKQVNNVDDSIDCGAQGNFEPQCR